MIRRMFIVGLLGCFFTSQGFAKIQPEGALEKAYKVLHKYPVIDGHNDLPWNIREQYGEVPDLQRSHLEIETGGETDIPKLRRGKVGGQFWSVWVPNDIKEGRYAKVQLEQIDLVKRMVAQYSDTFVFCTTAKQVKQAMRQGKIASMLGIEGGHVIENSLPLLRMYYGLGVRYMTLTHSKTIDWADSATDKARSDGLSDFGKTVIKEMNRLGMMIDLSHVSEKVMQDVLALSQAPIIFSHSNAKAVSSHPRNVPDNILAQVKDNNGIVMVNFVSYFLTQESRQWAKTFFKKVQNPQQRSDVFKQAYEKDKQLDIPPSVTVKHVADHIQHIRDVAGVDHIGLGGDFWGSGITPDDLRDVSRYPYLFAELIERGWSDRDLAKLAQQNILRVMTDVEKVAKQ
ncbi:MAG: dipeptidase [Bdellovibrionota bacterium]|nr:dipeptidase [Deltaproteobacteria bacterium]